MSKDAMKFWEAAARELPEEPDPRLEADLVARMAANAVAAAPREARRVPRMPMLRMPARVAFAAGALLISTAGLAVAGVKLPGPVDDGFSKVGIDLPNQPPDKDDDGGPAVLPGTDLNDSDNPSGDQDPGRGQGERPRQGRNDHGRGHGPEGRPGRSGKAPGHNKPAKPAHTPPGQSKPESHGPKAEKPAKPAKGPKPSPPLKPATPQTPAGGDGNGHARSN